MIYSIRVLFVILLAVFGAAFQNAGRVNSGSSLKMALKDYREELAKTAAAIAAPGAFIYPLGLLPFPFSKILTC